MQTETSTQHYTYKNRELDWLRFNHRVLQEAGSKDNPLYERLKFLAIFSSNLDEFFRVRISKLRQIRNVKKSVRKPLGLKPNRLLKEIFAEVHSQQETFGHIFQNEIVPMLEEHNIFLNSNYNYSQVQRNKLQVFFKEKVLPSIRTFSDADISVDSFEDGQLYIAVSDVDFSTFHFIEVPTTAFGRFIPIESHNGAFHYTFLEDILKSNLSEIFPENNISHMANIKISKDAELYLDDDYEGDWVEQIYESLKKRQTGQPVRMLMEKNVVPDFQNALRKLLHLGKVDVIRGGVRHNFSDFFDFPVPFEDPSLHYSKMPPIKHRDLEGAKESGIFSLLRTKDILLNFPYQSFEYVENWLFEAARDDSVHSINISLYRVANESKLTSALMEALDRGKKVTIFVETKARFDEANNIKWGKKFEDRGGKVFYSFPNVKVHSKVLLIERQENDALKRYAYVGTGNFNSRTARFYCDHALITSNAKITADLDQVFRVLRRELLLPKLKTLLISPYNSRISFEELIQQEIENATRGLPASISGKMNSLEDKRMIDWLYRASNAGVKVRLLVRGFCCLVPGISGQSENISVTSIVDRFLEHGRVFLFHANGEEKMFMGSADWMTRNLDKRIEVIVPVQDTSIRKELKDILELQFADNVKARIVDSKSSNSYVNSNGNTLVRSQYAIYDHLKLINENIH